ncbi:MAG: DUF2797 domain-containing protein [Candidatus Thorarchaeota archaeon]|nr:DUF2797 domain-containing protein [Candidatus Thorarchaeota archaeon]
MDGTGRKDILVLIDSPLHIISPTWRETAQGFVHGLTGWTSDSDQPEFYELKRGEQIKWSVTGPKRCVGFRGSDGRSHQCPERTIIQGRGTQCGPCSGMDYLAECIRCNGSVCNATPQRREQCKNTEYVVYIVVFAGGRVKVGVSTKERYRTRWVEQGADFAGIIRQVRDGKIARQIESKIGALQNVAMVVSRRKKADALSKRIEAAEAARLVKAALSEVPSDLADTHNIELEDLSRYYAIDELDSRPLPWRTQSNSIEHLSIVGEIVGMKGSFLITRNGTAFQYIDLKGIIGYTLVPDNSAHVTTQAGLLDFFE